MSQRTQVSTLFSRAEIQTLTTRSDWRGAVAVGSTWVVIAFCFAVVAWASQKLPLWVALLVGIVAVVVLAGRQLALGILTHDAAHRSLFKTAWLNDHLTDWLCARPVWNNLQYYRPYHLRHHAKTSTPQDPDLCLVAGLPTTRASLLRKFFRDISGITGMKFVLGRILMDAGVLQWTVTNNIQRIDQTGRRWWDYPRDFIRNSAATLLTNAILLGVLALTGHAWLYALWLLAYVTPFPLLIRIRSMAEHAALVQSTDVLQNTRTTRAGFLARALVAPIRVNYHIEHHLMASVPYFNLPKMHQMLRSAGHVPAPPTYWQVFHLLSTRDSLAIPNSPTTPEPPTSHP